jgi:hypothetical protein
MSQTNDEIKPLTEIQMEQAKKWWARGSDYVVHEIKGSYTPDQLIEELHKVIPDQYWDIATVEPQRDRDDYYSPWLEVIYKTEETDEEYHARLTRLYREHLKFKLDTERKKEEKERKEYERLKAKFGS